MPCLIAVLAVLLVLSPAQAQTTLEASVGGASLLLPVPDGFTEPSISAPILRTNAEAITAPPMRLIAVFVDEEDRRAVERGTPPSFRRYFMVQVLRARESETLDESSFLNVKSQVTGLNREAFMRVSDELRKHVDSAAMKIGTEAGVGELALDIGRPRQLGLFHETDSSVSTMLVTRASASTSTRTIERTVAQATSTILLKGKVVFFTAYSEVNGGSDYDWLRGVSRVWVESARQANRQ